METPPPAAEIQTGTKPRSSLFARLLNIFAVPGDVFEEVKASPPSTANWLVPTFIFGMVAAVAAFLILSQPAIMQKAREKQTSQIEERVKAGKMTRQQADEAEAVLEKFSGPIVKVTGSIGAFISGFVALFWWAFLLWLIGRVFLKAPVSFMKMAEVAGLASAISTLAVIVKLLLAVSLSNPMASPSLALLVKDPDPNNKLVGVLAMVDIMTFWVLLVRAIGLARFSNVSVIKAAAWVFGVWLLMMGLLMGIATAIQKMFGA